MSWARRYALRFTAFSASRDAALYGGTQNYGDSTYGQEASDPLSNVEYVLTASPGEYPTATGWTYRAGDTDAPFQAQVLGIDGPMNLTPVDTAVMVLERVSSGNSRVLHAVSLTPGTTDGLVTGTLPAAVLAGQGQYRVAVQLQFTSGRVMTVTPNDDALVAILGG